MVTWIVEAVAMDYMAFPGIAVVIVPFFTNTTIRLLVFPGKYEYMQGCSLYRICYGRNKQGLIGGGVGWDGVG